MSTSSSSSGEGPASMNPWRWYSRLAGRLLRFTDSTSRLPGCSVRTHASTRRTASSPTPRPRAAGATQSEMSSTSAAFLAAVALTMPIGSPSSVSTRFKATFSSRPRHRSSLSPAPLQSARVDPNAAGDSDSAWRRNARQRLNHQDVDHARDYAVGQRVSPRSPRTYISPSRHLAAGSGYPRRLPTRLVYLNVPFSSY
jgi:hypothetical protein